MLEEYNKAYKLGKKDYQARMMKGRKAYVRGAGRYSACPGILFRSFSGTGSDSPWSRLWEQKQNPEAMPLQGILCPFCVKIQNLPISGQFLEQVM